jgi:hypothetical protein
MGLFKFYKKKTEWGFRSIYGNKVTAVDLTFEQRDFCLFVRLVKLRNGEFPANPGEIRPDSVLDGFDLDDILGLRSPERLIPPHSGSSLLNITFFDQLVATQVNNLREFASDVLRGDFSVFAELDHVVKRRAREAAFKKWGQRAVEFGWLR